MQFIVLCYILRLLNLKRFQHIKNIFFVFHFFNYLILMLALNTFILFTSWPIVLMLVYLVFKAII